MSSMAIIRPNAKTLYKYASRLRITDIRTGSQSLWVPNVEQKEIFSKHESSKKIFILKSRQIGASTAEILYDLLFTAVNDFSKDIVNTWLIWDTESKAVEKLNGIEDFAAQLKITCRKRDNQIIFPNGSKIIGMTAGGKRAGAGLSCHHIHASEMPFWRDAAKTWTSLMPALNDKIGTMTIETTMAANADLVSGLWHDNGNGIEHLFFPVEMNDVYKIREKDKEWLDKRDREAAFPLRPEFAERLRKEGFTNEDTMRFMQRKLLTMGGIVSENAWIEVLREYPQKEDHCFRLAKGRWIQTDPQVIPHTSFWLNTPRGNTFEAKIYKEPVFYDVRRNTGSVKSTEGRYFIGVDTGGGLGKDQSSVSVIDRADGSLAAFFSSNTIATDEFATVVMSIADKYQTKYVYVEKNGIGQGVVDNLTSSSFYCIPINTSENSKYHGLLLARRYIEGGIVFGPSELLIESRSLYVEGGEYKGRKDGLMSLGFALIHHEKLRWTEPKTFAISEAKLFRMGLSQNRKQFARSLG